MSDRQKKLLIYWALSPLAFLVSLVAGAYWTFPYDQLREFIVQRAEASGSMQLEIASLEPSWVTGIEVQGLRITMIPSDPHARPSELVVREATARVSLLSLLVGTTEVSFGAELDAGTIEGVYAASSDSTHIEAELHDVDLRRLGPVRDMIPVPITGSASGTIDLTIASEAAMQACLDENGGLRARQQCDEQVRALTAGTINLTIRGLSIADGHTPLALPGAPGGGGSPFGGGAPLTLTLERMSLGALTLRMTVERGVGRIEELHADGPDAELRGTGSVRLQQPFELSSLDLLLRVGFKPRYREANDRMRGLFALLDMRPEVAPARTPDGSLQWRISGPLGPGRMRMMPSGRTPMPGAN